MISDPTNPTNAQGESSAEGDAPAHVSAMLKQARQHLIRNNAPAAMTLLKEIAVLADANADLRLQAAKMLATAGASADAAVCYLNAGLGYLYDQGDMEKARDAFTTANTLDPQNLDVIFHLGQADVVDGRPQDGLAKFVDVLRRSNLKYTPALFEAGCIYQASGQYDQAILAYKKVLDRDKGHVQAIIHMGQLHQIKGVLPEAMNYYLRAAVLTQESKQLGTTRQILSMVLATDPGNTRARGMLADLDAAADEEELSAPSVPIRATAAPAVPLQQPLSAPYLQEEHSAAVVAAEVAKLAAIAEKSHADSELAQILSSIEQGKRPGESVAAEPALDEQTVPHIAEASMHLQDDKAAAETKLHEVEDSLITTALGQRRVDGEAGVKDAEALRMRREIEAETLLKKIAALEDSLRDSQARLSEQLTGRQPASAGAAAAGSPAEIFAVTLRTIESLASEGDLSLEIAAELESSIHDGRAREALLDVRRLASAQALPGPSLLVLGDLCRDLGDFSAARTSYQAFAIADARNAQLANSRLAGLMEAFAKAAAAGAEQRSDMRADANDSSKALRGYADLAAHFPDDPFYHEEIGSLHERLGNPVAAALAYHQAMVAYLRDDEVAHALALAPRMIASRPDDAVVRELAASAYERAGRRDESVKALEQALSMYEQRGAAADVERVTRTLAERSTDPIPYRRKLSELLLHAGDPRGAADQLLVAAEKLISWSRGTDALSLIAHAGSLCDADAQLNERVASLTDKAAKAERSVEDFVRGKLLLAEGSFDRAVVAFRLALEDNPQNGGAAYQLACLLMDHSQDYAQAEDLLQLVAGLQPDDAAPRFRLALAKASRGSVVEAVKQLIDLARFDEANANFVEQFIGRLEKDTEGGGVAAKYRYGIALRELRRVDEALVVLQSIQRETDYVVLCHNAIGQCLRNQGLDTAAAKRFNKAIETPGYPDVQYHEALYNLGDLYEAKDTPENLSLALASFEELYASDTTFKDVADRLRNLRGRAGSVDRSKIKLLPRALDQA
ncbi:MAG: hypothetical protein DLM53_12270 [Candidatus Eremiobacter antarcticus]|nr:tetratricopeptide repeat protein [Candidatus Eremiobacteraeota bacterium]MBC5808888.1 tetratricopeptide repeat protein [Candidatus Eremiobacteraeota bacterium]PZR60427.1 MAG: hypothetical protein DLM53_12270 [Candidatus Eremiobacter sp. RRmetagenome_bin22]